MAGVRDLVQGLSIEEAMVPIDLAKLEVRARSVKTREDLEQIKRNMRDRGDVDAERLVAEILQERFPLSAKVGGGGATPTDATFRGTRQSFDTGKDAYLWLIEQFRIVHPGVLDAFCKLQARVTRAKGRRFAKSVPELFPPGSKRATRLSYSAALTGGWYTDVNLDHDSKFMTLLALSQFSGLKYAQDWDFRPTGGTQVLREHQEAVVRAEEMLADWLAK